MNRGTQITKLHFEVSGVYHVGVDKITSDGELIANERGDGSLSISSPASSSLTIEGSSIKFSGNRGSSINFSGSRMVQSGGGTRFSNGYNEIFVDPDGELKINGSSYKKRKFANGASFFVPVGLTFVEEADGLTVVLFDEADTRSAKEAKKTMEYVFATPPKIAEITTNGECSVEIEREVIGQSFTATLDGATSLAVKGGSSTFESATISANGASSFRGTICTKSARLDSNGASTIKRVTVTEKLVAGASGASDIDLTTFGEVSIYKRRDFAASIKIHKT